MSIARKQRKCRTAISVLVTTLIAACNASTDAENLSLGELTAKGVIFSAEQVERFPSRRSLALPAPHWTPTRAEVEQLEEKLEGYLRNSNTWLVDVVLANLSTYKYQYVGYSNAGRKMIWVNGFCPYGIKIQPMWQSRPLLIGDGGPCFFEVRYDPATESFEQLFVHGPV